MRSVPDLKSILQSCKSAGPASSAEVRSAEGQLGVTFPRSYRAFLEEYGAVVCAGSEIAGLFAQENPDEPPFWTHVVSSTEQLRRGALGALPITHIPIADDGMDQKFYLDLANVSPSGECPVVVLGPGRDNIVVADDFVEFAALWIQGRLEY